MKNRAFVAACLMFLLAIATWLGLDGARHATPGPGAVSASPPPTPAMRETSPGPGPATNAKAVLGPIVRPARAGALLPVVLKKRVPTAADEPVAGVERLTLPPDFLDRMLDADGHRARFALPDGRAAVGNVELVRRDAQGVLFAQGRLTQPAGGMFFFQRQTVAGVAGALVGNVRFDQGELAFRVDPTGVGGAPQLVPHRTAQVICKNLEPPDPTRMAANDPQNAPQTHPTNIPIPTYQNGVIPLQSLPGALAVIYLDFDGEPGPFPGWGNFDAAPSGATNAEIKDVWQRVAEDYQAFNINITTDRKVFDNAPQGSRQHCILTPTTTAAPGAGGVSYVGSFNFTGDTVNWAFYSTGKAAAEVVSHECGHALGLSHDGQNLPDGTHVEYYAGQGSGEVGWAPIMGVGYYQNLVQWSKGEYANPSNTEDDLSIITNNNNNVDFRADAAGATFATAPYLEVLPDNTVSNEGIIETSADVDAFRFTTTGGAASLTVSTVNAGPDLDILAEIYDASNVFVASNNPDTALSATVSATLAAGDYTLRVSGVGRGDPLVDGYTDYASIGAYLITGSVAGGAKPDRFTIAENSAKNTSVGTVMPRNAHGADPLTFAIASGNGTGTAFAIDPANGALTVNDVAQMDFEALSLRWDDPATFQLFVTITDGTNPALNETVRVVVTLTDVNEAPTIGGGSLTMLDHTRIGTKLLKVPGSDPDHFDFPTFSIVAGNTNGAFAIDPGTGQITVAADTDATVQSVYTLTVRATDQAATPLTASATVTITLVHTPSGYTPGTITRTFFENITGSTVANLTSSPNFPNNPDSEQALTAFDGGSDHGDNYGSTVRGYLIPPTTGTYTFWIASDDASQLRISTNALPANATQRASVATYTNQYQWNANASQQTSPISLTAGTAYYFEARHKEGGGGDHVAVAWQGPGVTQQVIPGLFLAPYYQNYAPKVVVGTFSVRENAFNGTTVGTAQVTDVNAADAHTFAVTGGTGASVFGIVASTGRIFVANNATLNAAATPSYTLQIQTTDNGTPTMNGTGTLTINVLAAGTVNIAGIVQQIWTNIGGTAISALTSDPRYPNAPTTARVLTSFDTGGDYGDNYGSRIRAFVVPPTTGAYTFYLASDDAGQLLLSTDATAANAVQIASVATYTARNTWTTFPTQTSAAVTLTAGQPYYIETLQKEGGGGDFTQVAWTGPGISTPTIIPGSALQPFDVNTAPVFTGTPYSYAIAANAANGSAVGTVVASDPTGDALVYAITGGNPGGAFTINALTGAITVANSAALPAGQIVNLQIAVQDDGTGGLYPLKSAATTAAVTVGMPIRLVSPTVSTVQIPNGVGLALAADNAGRNGTTIAWTEFSGPGTVAFDTAAALVTGATFSAPGAYVLRCAETSGSLTTTFDVAVNVGITLPFTGAKVGAQAIAPGYSLNAGAYTISAAGNGIPSTGTPDDFYFLNLPVSGNVTVTARVFSEQNINGSNSRAGVMIRETLAADSREAFCGITAINGQRYIYRVTPATNSANAANNPAQTPFVPYWVRLIRSANSFAAQIAPDVSGAPGTFVAIGTAQTLGMTSNVFVGIAATSGSTSTAGSVVIDHVTVSPSPVNVAANVSAGADATITLPNSAALDGTVTDDGKPAPPAAVTTVWSKFSGPGTVTFGNASAVDTSASFSTTGTYILRLTADDGQARTYDDVALTVQLAPIDQWRAAHFGQNAGNPAIAGDLADPDLDGLSNLIEYGLGLDPVAPGVSGLVVDLETIGPDQYLRLTAAKNPAATDVTFGIEVTGTITLPASWTTNGTTIETNTSSMLRVRDNTPISSAVQRNIRLKITHP